MMIRTVVRTFLAGLILIFGICGSSYTVMASANLDIADASSEFVRIEASVKSADPDEEKITLNWEALPNASEYTVVRKDGEEWVEVCRTVEVSAAVSVNGLGVSGTYKVRAYDAEGMQQGESDELALLIPGEIDSLFTTSQSRTKARLYWDESDGATSYQVYVKRKEGDYELFKKVKKPEIRLEVKEKERCHFQVVPVFECQAGEIEGPPVRTAFDNREIVVLDHQKYSYTEMTEDVKALCKKYSEYVSYESIGQSEQGRKIYDVVLGNPDAVNTILVVSALHGREYITTAVCMKQLEFYLLNYNKTIDGKKLSEIFEGCNVHYIMMANPDGVTISQKSNARWKGNANGVNLNRNFPYKFRKEGKVKDNNYSGPKAASESETKAIIARTKELYETQNLAVVNYHAMGNIVYGDYSGKNAYLKRDVGQMYQIARKTTGYAGVGNSSGGSNGNYREYLMFNLKIPSITLEIGSAPCPVPQYQYMSAFNRNKLLVLREADWLVNSVEE